MPATEIAIRPGVRVFLDQLIDYAGLFPPATLPLDEALRNYRLYRQVAESWMLSRFIIPAARLAEVDLDNDAGPLPFSILGRGGPDATTFLENLRAELVALAAFKQRHGRAVTADVFEVRLPAAVTASGVPTAIHPLLTDATARLAEAGVATAYYEVAAGPKWPTGVAATIEAMAAVNRANHEGSVHRVGYKLRCGGVEAAVFPSVEQVAFVIDACRRAEVAMKMTAGLHHPIRHYDAEIGVMMHGFVNVFGAGILAHARGLEEAEIAAIVAEESPEEFVFSEDGFSWRGLAAGVEEIAAVRQQLMIAFGSCSFEEPCQDLRALGWL